VCEEKARVELAGGQPEPVPVALGVDRGSRHRVTRAGLQQPAKRGNAVLHLAFGGGGRSFVPHGVDEGVEGDAAIRVDEQ
jgi:hypothetical protein